MCAGDEEAYIIGHWMETIASGNHRIQMPSWSFMPCGENRMEAMGLDPSKNKSEKEVMRANV
jgi:hypothetical protein